MRLAATILFLASGCAAIQPEQAYPNVAVSAVNPTLDATVALVDEDRVFCTGVVLDYRVLTASHCVRDRYGLVEVTFRSEMRGVHPMDSHLFGVVYDDQVHDFAILQPLEAVDMPRGRRLSPEDADYGDPVVIVGHPRGYAWTMTAGIVSHPRREFHTDEDGDMAFGGVYLQIDSAVAPGNSGGPVFNEFGEILGIVSWRSEAHLGFAVHLSVLKSAL